MIYFGSDHRGYLLKEYLKAYCSKKGILYEDVGADKLDLNDDYVDFSELVAEKVLKDPENSRGVLICGSGHGMDMAANKFKGIRAALCFNVNVAVQSRQHENSNVLVLASDWLKQQEAEKIFDAWISTSFSKEERHERRLKKISGIEGRNFKS